MYTGPSMRDAAGRPGSAARFPGGGGGAGGRISPTGSSRTHATTAYAAPLSYGQY